MPEPVGARPEMSRPAKASGSVAAWMGKGRVMPPLFEHGDEICGHAEVGEGGGHEDSSSRAMRGQLEWILRVRDALRAHRA